MLMRKTVFVSIFVATLFLSGCFGSQMATETQEEYEPVVWEFTAYEPIGDPFNGGNMEDGDIMLEMTQGTDLDYERVSISVQKWGGGSDVWFPECSQTGETNCWDRNDPYDNTTWDVNTAIKISTDNEGNYSVTITIDDCMGPSDCVPLGETTYTHETEE